MLWINKIKNFKLIVMFDIWLRGGCLNEWYLYLLKLSWMLFEIGGRNL